MRHLQSVVVIVSSLVVAAHAADRLGEDLIKAAKKGDVAKVQALIKQGTPVDSQDGDRKTALWEATRHDKADVVALLIEAKADLNLADKDGITPLLLGAGRDDPKSALLLLKAGADTTVRTRRGGTVLMAAAGGGHAEMLGPLLKAGGKVTDEDAGGETPLHYAAEQGRAAMIRALLDARAEVDHESKDGETPLMQAAGAGHSEAVSTLLQAGAQPNLPNPRNKNWTALMYAAKGGTSGLVDELAARGADVNLEDATGDQPIHIAARAGLTAVVGALIDKGSYVNAKGGVDHRSPLEIAVDRDDRSTAEMLLSHGSCVTRTAIDLAAKKKSEKVIKLLGDNAHNACKKP